METGVMKQTIDFKWKAGKCRKCDCRINLTIHKDGFCFDCAPKCAKCAEILCSTERRICDGCISQSVLTRAVETGRLKETENGIYHATEKLIREKLEEDDVFWSTESECEFVIEYVRQEISQAKRCQRKQKRYDCRECPICKTELPTETKEEYELRCWKKHACDEHYLPAPFLNRMGMPH